MSNFASFRGKRKRVKNQKVQKFRHKPTTIVSDIRTPHTHVPKRLSWLCTLFPGIRQGIYPALGEANCSRATQMAGSLHSVVSIHLCIYQSLGEPTQTRGLSESCVTPWLTQLLIFPGWWWLCCCCSMVRVGFPRSDSQNHRSPPPWSGAKSARLDVVLPRDHRRRYAGSVEMEYWCKWSTSSVNGLCACICICFECTVYCICESRSYVAQDVTMVFVRDDSISIELHVLTSLPDNLLIL